MIHRLGRYADEITDKRCTDLSILSLNKVKERFQCSYEQKCIPVGCVPSAALAVPGGGEGCLPDTLPVNRITDRFKNIAATTLRTVINEYQVKKYDKS